MTSSVDGIRKIAGLGGPLSKTNWAYDAIRELIQSGELAPDEPIDQQALAAQLGLSTTPLREALRRLESERLVLVSGQRMKVTALSRIELDEIFTVRIELEQLAIKLACQHASDEELSTLEALAPCKDTGDPPDLEASFHAFHRMLGVASHNQVLANVLDDLWNRFERYLRWNWRIQTENGKIFDYETPSTAHIDVAQYINARDARAANAINKEHLEQVLEGCRTRLDEA